MNNKAFYNLSYGVYIVGTMNGNDPVGCIANSAMQVTVEPATIAVSINHTNFTHDCVEKSGLFSLSIMPENTDGALIGKFGFQSGRDIDKYADTDYTMVEGAPVISASCGHFVCKVVGKLETATHTVFLGEVISYDLLEDSTPMTYAYYHKVIKGKAPKAAPTYIENEDFETESSGSGNWVCSLCKYEYDGDIPFEDLPDDYVCPICGMPKSAFEKE